MTSLILIACAVAMAWLSIEEAPHPYRRGQTVPSLALDRPSMLCAYAMAFLAYQLWGY